MPIDRRTTLHAALGTALLSGCATPSRTPRGAETRPRSAAPSYAATPGLPAQVVHGPRTRAAVALTFHGQGDPALAAALLSAAERAGAEVTVFAVGDWLDAYPRMARRILDGGHELANHTQRHLDICAMDAAAARAEIAGCAERLRRLTGSAGAWFRPSRARLATPLVRRLAREAGYPHCLAYDVDSRDYTDPGAGAVRDTVAEGVRNGSVVSLHLGHQDTVAALPGILADLRERGLRAVTASRLTAG